MKWRKHMSRVAVITGGTRGIGAAIARTLKAAGYKVVVVDVVDQQITKFQQETGIPGYKIDVSNFSDVEVGFKKIEKEQGPIDIVVNNAGITRDGFLHKMTPQHWQDVINVNLSSVFNTSRVVIPAMRERGFGRIVNISSLNGQRGQFAQTNYSAAKAGILGFTKALAQESAPKGITVNAICPGFILTEMTGLMKQEILDVEIKKIPVGRIGTPEEVADAVLFLVKDESSFVTGSTISLNGGQGMY
jgi:acetoacetyl-CoA reductase